MYKITLIPGDGIGPEVTNALLHVLEAVDLEFDYTWPMQEMNVIMVLVQQFPMKHCPKQKIPMQLFLER